MDKKVKTHVTIVSVVGICLSLIGALAAKSLLLALLMGILPLALSIAFLVTKHPVFGILYTVFFFLGRFTVVFGGTLLAAVMVLLLTGYFSYVVYLCFHLKGQSRGTGTGQRG